eukprot:5660-Heterococcus_DN1.PRE.1
MYDQFKITHRMSEKPTAAASSNVVKAIVEQASEVDVEDSADMMLKDRFDKEFQVKLKKMQRMKFKHELDLIERWPLPSSELSEEDGVYTWQAPSHTEYIVLSQDIIPDILAAEWATLPNATGRIKFTSHLKARYVGGPSQGQVTQYLMKSDEHQIFRQRRKSQRTATSVAQAPFKQFARDLTDIPARSVYRYLFVVVDLFSNYCWAVPLAKKSGVVVARELQKIFDSLPTGARVGSLRSDNGTEFLNPEVKAVLDKTGTKQVRTLPGNPLGNGGVESLNRSIKTNLFSDTQEDKTVGSFAVALKKTILNLNSTVHSSHGFIPALLHRSNLEAGIIDEVLKRLNAQAQGRDVNLRYQPMLMPGDKVRIEVGELLNSIKLQQKAGSYKPSHTNTFSREKRDLAKNSAEVVPKDAKDLSSKSTAEEAQQKRQKRVSQTANLPVTRELRSAVAGSVQT